MLRLSGGRQVSWHAVAVSGFMVIAGGFVDSRFRGNDGWAVRRLVSSRRRLVERGRRLFV